MRQLEQAWRRVLPTDVYSAAMGDLLSTVAKELTLPLLACTEFEEDQTHHLHRLIARLAEVEGVFDPPDSAAAHAPGWSKLRILGAVMEMSLEQIGEELGQGTFREFNADELSGLVCAIFQESPARAEVLAAIQHM